MKENLKPALLIVAIVLVLVFGIVTLKPEDEIDFNREVSVESSSQANVVEAVIPVVPEVLHKETPEQVKGAYMTSWVAGTPSIRTRVVNLIETTELNSIIIDIKDDTGKISFIPTDPALLAIGGFENRIPNVKEFIKTLHEKDIYVMGRIAVFQDPYLTSYWPEEAVKRASDGAVWKDRKGLSWMDAGSERVWDYVVAIAKNAYELGFDEINFDYVRFPSDGNMGDIAFPTTGDKVYSEVMKDFFAYLHENLKDHEMVTSVDLFGMTTTNDDDLGIGQKLEFALPYFDYVAPMSYPSHYPPTWMGYPDPNLVPGIIMKLALEGAKEKIDRMNTIVTTENVTNPETGEVTVVTHTSQVENPIPYSKIRPWLQDFDYGGDYGPVEVRAQIDAVYQTGLDSWVLWDPRNVYTRGALKVE